MIESMVPCSYEERVSLAATGYYAIGGEARWMLRPQNVGELAAALEWCRRSLLPVIVAGKGSNMLFSDEGFPGAVLSLEFMNRLFRISEDLFFCEAGIDNTAVAIALQQAGKSGGEWLYRLPGTIGATVRMNARCYGREISALTRSIVTVGLDGTVRWRQAEEVFRGYKRTSLMLSPEIVVGAVLECSGQDDPESIGRKMQEYGDDRDVKHQFDFPSCGSVFKNNYDAGRPSGQIFDALGFRGRREGGAQVSDHHANFIFNTGGAKAIDVLRLSADMRIDASQKAGVDLELELQCAGLFEASLLEACGIAFTPEPSRPGYGWTGLLLFPAGASAVFPRTLIEGPMLDYHCRDCGIPDGIIVRVEQLISLEEAGRTPNQPFIRWSTFDSSGSAFSSGIEAPEGVFVERLWEQSVSELFISHGSTRDGYLEFEVTPDGKWLALCFDASRRRTPGHEKPSAEHWDGGRVKPFAGGESFGMEFSFALLEPFILDNHLSMQCCASLGEGRYGLFPWWCIDTQPDFHQPARWCPVGLV
ncbi:MAG: UDP-N-acetylmuramate dehydrogenase [Chlorobiaceae bacterium]|nr:UDP-N-acetylmuramate dehydrogenase [Chlorobiaceae bacterium]